MEDELQKYFKTLYDLTLKMFKVVDLNTCAENEYQIFFS